MKSRACSVNHDDIFGAFYANRMRDPGWNDHSHIVAAAVIIAFDEETHDAPGKTSAHIAQNHLHGSLEKKHDVPLLVIITTQRIIFRRAYEQTSQPFLGGCIGRNAWWMHMKSL